MSVRGVWQLKKLTLSYCNIGGSSKGQRDFLQSQNYQSIKLQWPHVEFEVLKRGSKHPYVKVCGISKVVCVKNKQQQDIAQILQQMHDSRGYKSRQLIERFRVVSKKPSIQGPWNFEMISTE